jgi:hypothetical protein
MVAPVIAFALAAVASTTSAAVVKRADPVDITPENQKCFGFGFKWADGEVYQTDNKASTGDAIKDLAKQCGAGDKLCKKWVRCDRACGAIAIPPDSMQLGGIASGDEYWETVGPVGQRYIGVNFGESKEATEAAALKICDKRLVSEQLEGMCQILASYCWAAPDDV